MPLEEVRSEVQEYAKACERLIASCASPSVKPFSQDELHLLRYYTDEVRDKLLSEEAGER
jgi:hypothetical protein